MIRTLQRHEPALGAMLSGSLLLHALFFLIAVLFPFLPLSYTEAPVYYVEMVDLPVANPQAGAPSSAPAAEVPAAPAPVAAPTVKLPVKSAGKAPTPLPAAPPQSPVKGGGDESAQEFAARMEKLEEARHEAAALEALQKRLAPAKSGPSGMPKATGKESGSDYGAYIQSRLRDALIATIDYQSRKPEASARLFIDKKGKLIRFVIEKSSKDKLFDDSVIRAINKAKGSFPPPPGGSGFEKLFLFSPEEVSGK